MRAIELQRGDNQRPLVSAFDMPFAMAFAASYSAKYHVDVYDEFGRLLQPKKTAQKEYSKRAVVHWKKTCRFEKLQSDAERQAQDEVDAWLNK